MSDGSQYLNQEGKKLILKTNMLKQLRYNITLISDHFIQDRLQYLTAPWAGPVYLLCNFKSKNVTCT